MLHSAQPPCGSTSVRQIGREKSPLGERPALCRRSSAGNTLRTAPRSLWSPLDVTGTGAAAKKLSTQLELRPEAPKAPRSRKEVTVRGAVHSALPQTTAIPRCSRHAGTLLADRLAAPCRADRNGFASLVELNCWPLFYVGCPFWVGTSSDVH